MQMEGKVWDSPAQPQGSDTGQGCQQTSQGLSAAKYLGLKGAGHFSPYKEGSLLVCCWGKAAGLLRRLKSSEGIWSLSIPEAG